MGATGSAAVSRKQSTYSEDQIKDEQEVFDTLHSGVHFEAGFVLTVFLCRNEERLTLREW